MPKGRKTFYSRLRLSVNIQLFTLYWHVFTNLRLIIDCKAIIGKQYKISFTLWYSIGRYYVTTVTININIIDLYTETTSNLLAISRQKQINFQ
jgi:hypothetical protein